MLIMGCVQFIGLVFIFIFAVIALQFFADRAEVQYFLQSQNAAFLLELNALPVTEIVWLIWSSCVNAFGDCFDDSGALSVR